MYREHDGRILDLLTRRGLLRESERESTLAEARHSGASVAMIAITRGLSSRPEIVALLAEEMGYPLLEQPPARLDPTLLSRVPAETARAFGVAPYRETGGMLELLLADPFNDRLVDDLRFTLGRDIEVFLCDPDHLQGLLREAYGEEEASIQDIIEKISQDENLSVAEADEASLQHAAREAPVIRLVDLVISQAIREKASDIHFEPFEDVFRIRYRVDGALYELNAPPRNLAAPVTSRIKVLADLNIAERRLPQDGRIKMTVDGNEVDLRVSTLPTQFGESVVLRVLDKTVVQLELDRLSMPDDVLATVREMARRPNGIFIVTGPTGSGKTTTLYSALREVNDEDTKILTAEDPVEYEIEGIVQTAIRPGIGLTFATALRSFLRQDPDKILVGEIRDLETAQIAVQASLTGHLVLSTLHTNDAAGAVTRLMDMGLEPYLIAASLECVLAQRLLRAICPQCREGCEPSAEDLRQLGMVGREGLGSGRRFYRGRGCAQCHGTGYRGRMGLFEIFRVDDPLRDQISRGTSAMEIRHYVVSKGMRTLRDEGLAAIFNGRTTVEEVLKYT